MFHTRDHFVPLARIYIHISFLLSPIQPLFPSNPCVPHPLSSSLFRMSSSSSSSFFFSPSNTIVRRSLLWMKHGYSWFLQFLEYFISNILCSTSSNLQSGRNRLSFRQSPYFRGAGGTTFHRERERIQIYSDGSWKYYRKILMKVCR